MPLTDKGQKVMRAMKAQYGAEKGESVFYASKNKGTISGVDGFRRQVRDALRRGLTADQAIRGALTRPTTDRQRISFRDCLCQRVRDGLEAADAIRYALGDAAPGAGARFHAAKRSAAATR